MFKKLLKISQALTFILNSVTGSPTETASHSSCEHLGLVWSAHGGVDRSPSNVGVDPSQQILSDLGHRRPLPPEPLTRDGVLPSAQVLGLFSSGHGGVVLSPSNTGAEPSVQVGAEPSAHSNFPWRPRPNPNRPPPPPLRPDTAMTRRTARRVTLNIFKSCCLQIYKHETPH